MYKTQCTSSDDDKKLDCYTNGDYWNGWAKVYFDQAQIMEWAKPYTCEFTAKGCIVHFEDPDLFPAVRVEIDGQTMTLYSMEGYCFMFASDL